MKRERLATTLLLLAAMLPAGCGSSSNSGGSGGFALADDATAIARKWVDRSDAPGAVVAVGMPDGRIWTTAVGIAEHNAPLKELDIRWGDAATNASDGVIPWQGRAMTPNLYLRIGSRTKTYTSALMLKLREAGLVDFNQTVNHYLPAGLVPNGDKVTVQMLLDMTSGIEDYLAAFSPYDLTKPDTPENILRYVRELANGGVRFAPGETVYYSNTNYVILGMIAQQVTGKSYQQLVVEKIIQPLGLRATVVPDPNSPDLPTPNAHGYKVDLPWDSWLSLWLSNSATPEEVLDYLAANPALVDAFAAQDKAAMSAYPDWVIFYLQSNVNVEVTAYINLHPDLLDALRAYQAGDSHALDPYPAPLMQYIVTTPGLIDQLLASGKKRMPGVFWRDSTNIYTSAFAPVGCVISTAADQVQWIRALEQSSFLSADSRALRDNAYHRYPLVDTDKVVGYYGIGAYKKIDRTNGNVFIGHGGRIEGYDSYGYFWKDRGWIVVVLVNALNLNLHVLDAGYPPGSVAGTIGEEIFQKIIANAQ